ncbi:CDP-diacylglycerol--serine O-phosphatidyltransferase [Candidatus Riflebacteria bacterium]
MKKFNPSIIPSLFTSANILCGYFSLCFSMNNEFVEAAWLLILAMIFDILDGRIARRLGAESRFGSELDSLADAISFGVSPAILMYKKYFFSLGIYGVLLSFIYLLCGVIRLARFNITPSKPYFEGLPIPGGAGLIATFILIELKYNLGPFDIRLYVGMFLLFAFLMISQIKFLSLKKTVKNTTKRQYLGYFMIAILLTRFPAEILFLIGYSYLFWGILQALAEKIKFSLPKKAVESEREVENVAVESGDDEIAARAKKDD